MCIAVMKVGPIRFMHDFNNKLLFVQGQGQSAIPPGSHQYVVRSLDLDHETPLGEPQDGTQLREGSQKSVSVPMWKRVAGVLAPALHPVSLFLPLV